MLFFGAFNVSSQSVDSLEIDKVKQVVNEFFIGLESGDSAALSSLFHSEIRLISTSLDGEKRNRIDVMSGDDFLQAISVPRDGIWEERVENLVVSLDQGLSNVWMDYNFYLNGELSHCGVNSFEMIKEGDNWLIVGISDTRRRKNCAQ